MPVMLKTMLSVAFSTAILTSCNRPVPKVDDATIQKIRDAAPGMTDECLQKIRFGGFGAMPERVDQCFKMSAEQRLSGLWRNDFEGQLFCSAPAQKCDYGKLRETVWLDFGPGSQSKVSPGSGGVYAIEFDGRSALQKGMYGHMGMFDREVIVDRLISIRQVESPDLN
jgi:hypothetical protein